MSRLARDWVYGGFLSGILMLVLLPEIARNWSSALLAVFLQLPIYMLHQYEEHDNDRFRRFVNRTIGGGREATEKCTPHPQPLSPEYRGEGSFLEAPLP